MARINGSARLLKNLRIYMSENDRNAWMKTIRECAILANPKSIADICDDSSDNKFIETAIGGDAHYIVTGGDDLLRLESCADIITPKKFLKILDP